MSGALVGTPDEWFGRADPVPEQLGDISDIDAGCVVAGGRDPIAEHGLAEGAARGDRGRSGRQGLTGAFGVDPRPGRLLLPRPGAAGPTPEGRVPVAGHLGEPEAGEGAEQLSWRAVDLVVPAEEARIVVGDGALNRLS